MLGHLWLRSVQFVRRVLETAGRREAGAAGCENSSEAVAQASCTLAVLVHSLEGALHTVQCTFEGVGNGQQRTGASISLLPWRDVWRRSSAHA